MSVPQMVVVVTRMSASSGPTSGIGLSSSTMRPGSTKSAAVIILVMGIPCLRMHRRRALAKQAKLVAQPRPVLDVDQARTG